jgi:ribonuclease P protein component
LDAPRRLIDARLQRSGAHGDTGPCRAVAVGPVVKQAPLTMRAAQKAALRLTRRAEFLRVAAKGRKAPTPGLVLQAMARGDTAPVRLGFTVTKKVGNAVVRNRTRRRLREAARLLLREAPAVGADLVLVGRDTTRTREFTQLIDDLRRSLAKLGVALQDHS